MELAYASGRQGYTCILRDSVGDKYMSIFNRTMLQRAGEYRAYEAARQSRYEDILNEPDSLRHIESVRGSSAWTVKRVFDVAVSAIALVLLAPVLIIAAIAIKVDSRGPVFFAQERIGLNRRRGDRRSRSGAVGRETRSGTDRRKSLHPGRPFRIYKFRTMVQDAERCGPTLACAHDPRITRVGRIMRKTRIDELPQFLNVILGDMSIIGPRPERSFFINKVRVEVPQFTMRLLVKPGITGLAQVENGYTSSIDEMGHKLFYDLKYIAEFSIWQEIRILFKTVYVVVTGKGAC